jgi:DNA processing protein
MARADVRAWLYLWRVPGIGPRAFRRLLDRFGQPEGVLGASSGDLEACGLGRAEILAALRQPDWSRIDADLAWLAMPGHHLVTLADPAYPPLLREAADAPPLLFVLGDPELLSQPQLAIVGSRNPTPGGRQTAREFAQHLASAGLTITSGLAEGIDAAAHEGALASGGPGGTVAVLGTGPDRVYPAKHRDLAHRIAASGALASEFPPGVAAQREHFPRRNRIISGLSLGTLVVEAALHSGSLITARQAMEQGREVFAIPGSIHNPLARGCHALLRQGAKLVETAQDILEELGSLLSVALTALPHVGGAEAAGTLDAEHRQLLAAMAYDPMAVDDLVAVTGLRAEAIASMLLLLELEGHVSSVAGGRYCRVRRDVAPA